MGEIVGVYDVRFVAEYAGLVRKVWEDGSRSSIAPRELKSRITRFAPRFGGYK